MAGNKVLVINTDRTYEVKTIDNADYKTFMPMVGGYVEIVRPITEVLNSGQCMIVNEEGLLVNLPINAIGTAIYGYGPIAGNVVIAREVMTPEGLDIVGLSDAEIEELKNVLIL